jgi:hypothetical protein
MQEALNCVSRDQQQEVKESPVQKATKRHGRFSKKEKVEDWTVLDGTFKEDFQKIWVISDRTELYERCQQLLIEKSPPYKEMVKQLSKHKIFIESHRDAIWTKGGEVNHSKLIEALKSFMNDHTVTETVNDVLNDALDCATDVQQFRDTIQLLKKGGKSSGLPHEIEWNHLNYNINHNLSEIFVAKEEPLDKEGNDADNKSVVKHGKKTVKFANNDGATHGLDGTWQR